MFLELGWSDDKAVFVVSLLRNCFVECEDIKSICKLFNISPNNDKCSGCQFFLSFVLFHKDVVYYHPFLEDQENYSVDDEFVCCDLGDFQDVLDNFPLISWSVK